MALYSTPEEHSGAVVIVFCADQIKDFTGQFSSATIFLIKFCKPFRPLFQCLDCSQLKRLEHSRIHLALHLKDLRNNICGTSYHSDAPSCHIVRLAERVHFQTALLCTRTGQDRKRLIVQYEAIRIVITYHYAMSESEIN